MSVTTLSAVGATPNIPSKTSTAVSPNNNQHTFRNSGGNRVDHSAVNLSMAALSNSSAGKMNLAQGKSPSGKAQRDAQIDKLGPLGEAITGDDAKSGDLSAAGAVEGDPSASQGPFPTFKKKPGESPIVSSLKTLGNVPSTIGNVLSNMVSAVVHPMRSIKGVANVVEGLSGDATKDFLQNTKVGQSIVSNLNQQRIKNGLPSLQTDPTGKFIVPDDQSTEMVNNLGKTIAAQYGSPEKFQKSLEEDPAGVALTLSSALDAGTGLAGAFSDATATASGMTDAEKAAAINVTPGAQGTQSPSIPTVGTAVNRTASAVGNASVAPFASQADTGAMTAFNQEGITAPVSALSKSNVVRSGEAILQKGVFGSGIQTTVRNATAALEKKVNSVISAVKPAITKSAESTGLSIQKGMKDFNDTFKKTVGNLYDEFSDHFGDAPSSAQNTIQTLQTLVKEGQQNFFSGVNPKIRAMLSRLQPEEDPNVANLQKQVQQTQDTYGVVPKELQDQLDAAQSQSKPKSLSFNELKNTRTAVGAELENDATGAYKRLYGALSQDMNKAVDDISQTPAGEPALEVAKALKDLNAKFEDGTAKIESNVAQMIEKSNPENIVKNIITKNSGGMLKQLKSMIGPDKFQDISDAWLANLFDQATNTRGFNVETFKNAMGKYDQDTIDQLLTPHEQNNLKNSLGQLEKYAGMKGSLAAGQKAAEGSQTAFLTRLAQLSPAVIGAGLAGNFGKGFLALLELPAEYGLAKFMNSDAARQLFTTGWKPFYSSKLASLGLTDAQINTIANAFRGANAAGKQNQEDQDQDESSP
jgi:hypothetical protein